MPIAPESLVDAQHPARFTTSEVQRLHDVARPLLSAHFLALSPEDRRLRFGASLSAESVALYVEGIDFERDAVFGIYDEALAVAGVAHVAFGVDAAELGLSVLPQQRGRGAGTALFARAAAHARNRSFAHLFVHCLAENAAMMHIAHKSGMHLVVSAGDGDASLALLPPSAASIAGEYMTERLALFDYALKAQVAAWKNIHNSITWPLMR